ncbi:MAG: sialate O-acetylesterase [Planctomycetota bacterium]
MRGRSVFLVIVLVLCGVASWGVADVKPHALFSDNMVLQRDTPLPVWGWAEPGEKVTVKLCGKEASAAADDKGKWMVKLDPLPAGGPFEMTVAGKNTITIKDVLIGEVWVGSGQSNMAMTVSRTANAEQDVAEAKYPQIRFFKVPMKQAVAPQEQCEGAWQACSPETAGGFSATAYFFALNLHQKLNVPVGILQSAVGGTAAEAWTTREGFESDPELKQIIEQPEWKEIVADFDKAVREYQETLKVWKEKMAELRKQGKLDESKKRRPPSPKYRNAATLLYNGMIAPIVPYAIRGAIWYQGENNAKGGRAYQYRKLLPAMIGSWRKVWGQGAFPFLFVQLPNYKAVQPEPGESEWAVIRESFLQSLSTPNTGMAITIDIGEEKDIHPKNKRDVGDRLALWARAKVYGENVVYCGPLYDSVKIEGDKIRIQFTQVGGGLDAKGGPLKQFAIAGEDKKFVWADAKIDGETVVVSSDKVQKPVAVRYAWADNPLGCNLYNKAGLPASPFRTDTWPSVVAEEVK